MASKVSIRSADKIVRQEGAIRLAAEAIGMVVEKVKLSNGSSYYEIRNEDHKRLATFDNTNMYTLIAKPSSREEYKVVKTFFEKAKEFDQSCIIEKRFVEVCDFQKKPRKGIVSRILRRSD